MKIGLAQINPTVGDIAGNAETILGAIHAAEKEGCELVVTPEMALPGYPPEDLILKPSFIKDNLTALKDLAPLIKKQTAVIGFIDEKKGKRFNAAAWIQKGRIKSIYHKQCLPNYGVFDEQRYFTPGKETKVETMGQTRIGITTCEDLWQEPMALKKLKSKRPHFVLNLSASPYHKNKFSLRFKTMQQASAYLNSPVCYVNMVGGQDELVFDGGSFVVNPKGKLLARFPQFITGSYSFDTTTPNDIEKDLSDDEEIFKALVLGAKDYVNKNGFEKVALGLSGGIDSALVATLAKEALGKDRVVGVSMPSRFNKPETQHDAKKLAHNLGIEFHEIPIEALFKTYAESLAPLFKDRPPNVTEENLQARIRGNLLMALSNKFGWLVLTTGNKSETSTGYCTLYGDMAGGFAVLKDVLKTTVSKLAIHYNKIQGKDIIPQSIINRPPTAELKEGQKDEESLGSYKKLDQVIEGYVENNWPLKKIIQKTNIDESYVKHIVGLIDRNEYKRRQAPPGIKITSRAFGRDHRMPITNRYKPHKN